MGSTESLIENQLDTLAGELEAASGITLIVHTASGEAIVRTNDDLEEAIRSIRRVQRQQRRQKERPPQRQATAGFDPRK